MNRRRTTNSNLAQGRAPGAVVTSTPTPSPAKPLKPILKKVDPYPNNTPVTVAPSTTPVAETPAKKEAPPVEPIKESPKNESVESNEHDIPSVDTSDASAALSDKESENGGSRKPFFKKIFGGVRKKPSVRAKERKIRQNRHLRKVILPKNALMALYEIKGIQIGDFIINSNMEGGFTALVTVNNCQYEGVGNSKGNAKTNACEKALRDFVIKKMMKNTRDKSVEPMETEESNEVATNGEEGNVSSEETDDVPMVNLASFALYKLFTAWESEGYHVPEFHVAQPQHNSQQSSDTSIAKKPVGRSELPPNWEIMHPATLLCIMRPRLTYTDCGNTGDATKPLQTVKVIVDEQEFVGVGRSKKLARKNVAIAVCNSLFGTNFQVPVEEE